MVGCATNPTPMSGSTETARTHSTPLSPTSATGTATASRSWPSPHPSTTAPTTGKAACSSSPASACSPHPRRCRPSKARPSAATCTSRSTLPCASSCRRSPTRGPGRRRPSRNPGALAGEGWSLRPERLGPVQIIEPTSAQSAAPLLGEARLPGWLPCEGDRLSEACPICGPICRPTRPGRRSLPGSGGAEK